MSRKLYYVARYLNITWRDILSTDTNGGGLKNELSRASRQFCDKETKTHLIQAENTIREIVF